MTRSRNALYPVTAPTACLASPAAPPVVGTATLDVANAVARAAWLIAQRRRYYAALRADVPVVRIVRT